MVIEYICTFLALYKYQWWRKHLVPVWLLETDPREILPEIGYCFIWSPDLEISMYIIIYIYRDSLYIYIYILSLDIYGCLFSPEATGGLPGHRWPPQKTVAPYKTMAPSNIDVQHRWNEIESIFVKMKHKKLFRHYEISITANSRSWQYIAKNMHEKTILDVTFLNNGV